MKEEKNDDYLDKLDLTQEPEAVFEEWAAGSSGSNEKDDEDDELDKLPEAPIRRRKGNPKTSTIVTCEVCGVVLKHPSRIKEHMRTHTGEKPFACDICGMCFSQRTPMLNHYRVQHIGDLPYVCSFGCGKRFVNKSRKNAHELRHVGLKRAGAPRPHLKPVRKIVGHLDDSIKSIVSFVNPSAVSGMYSTDSTANPSGSALDSDEMFPSSSEQPGGMTKDSSERIDDVISSVLSRVLAPAVVLNPEKGEQSSKKRGYVSSRATTVAQCNICGLMLKHPSKIAEHVRTHTGEKPYECGECGMTLSKATSLKVHIRRMHTSERPFPCEWECGMWFVTESVKKEHEMAVHAGVKRYACIVKGCKAVFARRNYLMRHRKSMHGDVFCPIFDNAQVTSEEASDPVIGAKMTFFEADPMIIVGEDDKLMSHFEDDEFVEQEIVK